MSTLSEYGAEIGMRVTCQRCGVRVFLRQIGYNNIHAAIENRHSFYDQFESMPTGWEISHAAGGWLCPNCVDQFNKAIRDFMKIAEPPQEET